MSASHYDITQDLLISYVEAYNVLVHARDAHRRDIGNTQAGARLQAAYKVWDAAAYALMDYDPAAYRRAHAHLMGQGGKVIGASTAL